MPTLGVYYTPATEKQLAGNEEKGATDEFVEAELKHSDKTVERPRSADNSQQTQLETQWRPMCALQETDKMYGTASSLRILQQTWVGLFMGQLTRVGLAKRSVSELVGSRNVIE